MNLLVLVLLAQLNATKNISCRMENHVYQLVHKQGDKLVTEDRDDWHVKCKIEIAGKVKFNEELPLARPTELNDAVKAVDEFRKTH
jgi:hypothetical protein